MRFVGNAHACAHAQRWALSHYGTDGALLFVSWLLSLDDDEQTYIYREGYPSARARFESTYPAVLAGCHD